MDHQASLDLLVRLACPDPQELQEVKDQWAPPDLLELRATVDQRALRATVAPSATPDQRDHLD